MQTRGKQETEPHRLPIKFTHYFRWDFKHKIIFIFACSSLFWYFSWTLTYTKLTRNRTFSRYVSEDSSPLFQLVFLLKMWSKSISKSTLRLMSSINHQAKILNVNFILSVAEFVNRKWETSFGIYYSSQKAVWQKWERILVLGNFFYLLATGYFPAKLANFSPPFSFCLTTFSQIFIFERFVV